MSKKNLKHAFVGQDSEDTQVKIEKACSLATFIINLFTHSCIQPAFQVQHYA